MAERIIKRVDKAAMTVPSMPQTIKRHKRVAAYARVSTASDEQMNSVEAQKDYFEKMILHHENWVLAGIYADEGISGTSIRQRKAFLEMIDDAMAGKIDLIVTKSVSRFARNTVDTLNMIRQLKSIGVEVYFEKENIYTLDTKGEFLITLMSSLAEEEARSLSENVKWGKRKAFSDGRYTLPYKRFLGYKKGTDNLPEIIPTEAQIVRWIYYLYLIGTAPSTISKMLTQVGIPTPGNKNRWSPSTIVNILQNEKYCGAALLQKEFTVDYRTKKTKVNRGELPQYYIEHDHDPIIPKEIFDEVQRCRRSRKRAGESHTLFANQLYCAECGSAYGPRRWHSTTQNDTVWECIHSYRNGRCCSSSHLYECLLIPIFREIITELIKAHMDVWDDCMNALGQYMDATKTSKIWLEAIEQKEEPSQTERTGWQIIMPKVMVYPRNILIFHIVDGSEIRYQMRKTTPHNRWLASYEKEEVLEAYQNGETIEMLAVRYEIEADTIRRFINKTIRRTDAPIDTNCADT